MSALEARIPAQGVLVTTDQIADFVSWGDLDGYVTWDQLDSGLGGPDGTADVRVPGYFSGSAIELVAGYNWRLFASGSGLLAASCTEVCDSDGGDGAQCIAAMNDDSDAMSCDDASRNWARCLCAHAD